MRILGNEPSSVILSQTSCLQSCATKRRVELYVHVNDWFCLTSKEVKSFLSSSPLIVIRYSHIPWISSRWLITAYSCDFHQIYRPQKARCYVYESHSIYPIVVFKFYESILTISYFQILPCIDTNHFSFVLYSAHYFFCLNSSDIKQTSLINA